MFEIGCLEDELEWKSSLIDSRFVSATANMVFQAKAKTEPQPNKNQSQPEPNITKLNLNKPNQTTQPWPV